MIEIAQFVTERIGFKIHNVYVRQVFMTIRLILIAKYVQIRQIIATNAFLIAQIHKLNAVYVKGIKLITNHSNHVYVHMGNFIMEVIIAKVIRFIINIFVRIANP